MNNRVYRTDKRLSSTGAGSDWFESALPHADIVLSDIASKLVPGGRQRLLDAFPPQHRARRDGSDDHWRRVHRSVRGLPGRPTGRRRRTSLQLLRGHALHDHGAAFSSAAAEPAVTSA